MEIQNCIRCGRGLKAPQGINATGDKAIAVYITVVTVGMRPRQRSKLRRSVLCAPCSVSIAFAPRPEGAFNNTVYDGLNELNEQSGAMVEAAREIKVNPRSPLKLMPGSQDKTLTAPVLKTASLLSAS
jgi:hypothetical protein